MMYFFYYAILVLMSTYELEAGRMCYNAKICIHSGVERCGVNKKDELRRFLDTCDMLEYNCLKKTDYTRTSTSKCSSLPPLDKSKETVIESEEDISDQIPGTDKDQFNKQGEIKEEVPAENVTDFDENESESVDHKESTEVDTNSKEHIKDENLVQETEVEEEISKEIKE